MRHNYVIVSPNKKVHVDSVRGSDILLEWEICETSVTFSPRRFLFSKHRSPTADVPVDCQVTTLSPCGKLVFLRAGEQLCDTQMHLDRKKNRFWGPIDPYYPIL